MFNNQKILNNRLKLKTYPSIDLFYTNIKFEKIP